MSNSTSIIEQSYAQSSLSLDIRPDGRARLVYRPLSIATGITPQANGSAQVSASNGNTHVLAGVKLEVCSAAELAGAEGQIVFSVEATPAALENLIPSSDSTTARLTEWLHTVFDPFLFNHPQLCILSAPQAKVWKVYIDLIILSASTQSGTLFDVATLATKAALWDLRIPKTRGVAFHSRQAAAPSSSGQQDQVDQMEMLGMKGLLRSGKPRQDNKNAGQVDFELESYWDEGLPLSNRESLPVAVTLHLSGKHVFVDATNAECLAAPCRLVAAFTDHGNLVALQQDSQLELEFARVDALVDVSAGLSS